MKYILLLISALYSLNTTAKVEVTDFLGRAVTLDSPAIRIVALAPHIVENLYSAGAGNRIVGAVDYCDYPKEAKKIPRVGTISSYSLEAILGTNPDLIIVWHSGRGGKVMEKLISLGLTVYASDPHSLMDIPKVIRDYGILAGTENIAEKAAHNFEKKHAILEKKYKNLPKVSTFYQVWNDPLQTLNGEHIISDVIRMCGGTNVFAKELAIAPKVSIESVLHADPQAIVTSGIITSGMGDEKPAWLSAWEKWPSIKAVRCNNLYAIPPDIISRHTYRLLKGAEKMCESLSLSRTQLKHCD